MYQFSRAIYRELAQEIDDDAGRDGHAAVLQSCERCIERLVTDRHYFARPARTLFTDIRVHFPMGAQARVWTVVSAYLAAADELVTVFDEKPDLGEGWINGGFMVVEPGFFEYLTDDSTGLEILADDPQVSETGQPID